MQTRKAVLAVLLTRKDDKVVFYRGMNVEVAQCPVGREAHAAPCREGRSLLSVLPSCTEADARLPAGVDADWDPLR